MHDMFKFTVKGMEAFNVHVQAYRTVSEIQ